MLLLLGSTGAGCEPKSVPNAPTEAEAHTPTGTRSTPEPVEGPQRGMIYVPAYSYIASADQKRTMLGVTLSVRNVDPLVSVTLHGVDYYDTPGHLVRRYQPEARPLRPLETAEYFVAPLDPAGGSGANFLVAWSAPEASRPLLAETVMVGHAGEGYLSFTSRGVELGVPALPEAVQPED